MSVEVRRNTTAEVAAEDTEAGHIAITVVTTAITTAIGEVGVEVGLIADVTAIGEAKTEEAGREVTVTEVRKQNQKEEEEIVVIIIVVVAAADLTTIVTIAAGESHCPIHHRHLLIHRLLHQAAGAILHGLHILRLLLHHFHLQEAIQNTQTIKKQT